jgi:hypothetical protein
MMLTKANNIKTKFNKIEDIVDEEIDCPGIEIESEQNIIKMNKLVELTENQLGLFPIQNLEKVDQNNKKLTTHSILYRDNTIYIGTYDENWNREGFGILYFTDGCKYTGEFKLDKMNGKGRIIYSTGDYYEGDFIDDKPNGQGTFTKVLEGSSYKGYWNNESKCGYGEEANVDGSIYAGEHLNDMKHGKGIFKWPDGTIYEGSFICNDIEGFGRIVYPDMKVYIGEWKLNKIEGRGVFFWPDSRCYIGYYKQDKKNNFGIFLFCDGKKYEGYWLDGKQHGYGLCSLNGTVRLGEWRFGKRIRWVNPKNELEYQQNLDPIVKNKEDLLNFCNQFNISNIEDPYLKDKLILLKI